MPGVARTVAFLTNLLATLFTHKKPSQYYSTIKLLHRDEDIDIQVESTLWRSVPNTTGLTLASIQHALHLPLLSKGESSCDFQATAQNLIEP